MNKIEVSYLGSTYEVDRDKVYLNTTFCQKLDECSINFRIAFAKALLKQNRHRKLIILYLGNEYQIRYEKIYWKRPNGDFLYLYSIDAAGEPFAIVIAEATIKAHLKESKAPRHFCELF